MLTILPPYVPEIVQVSISAFGCFLEHAADSNPAIVLSSEHRDARWIPIDHLADQKDVPEIYKSAVIVWKREVDAGLDEPRL